MAAKIRVWFDAEADFLEVVFEDGPGFMRETAHDAVMERLGEDGRVIGFNVLGVSWFSKDQPLAVELVEAEVSRRLSN